ncbi:MAG: 50S ribosomal protein L15 [Gemmatimonadota bacterium]
MPEDKKLGLDNLSPPAGAKHSRKRLGRGHGSGHGKTSGRGHKGQKSRSGASIPAWFEGGQMPLYRRVPKRGFKPYRREEIQIVNLASLAELDETEIGPEQLKARRLIGSLNKRVKVLGQGSLDRAITVRAHAFSASAVQKIEAGGGRAELIS